MEAGGKATEDHGGRGEEAQQRARGPVPRSGRCHGHGSMGERGCGGDAQGVMRPEDKQE